MTNRKRSLFILMGVMLAIISSCTNWENDQKAGGENLKLNKVSDEKPLNVIYILSDDHRYDFMGFTGKVPFLETPNMDKMALEGAHIENAFVTTSLCSPSRASILTGQFSHHHQVVDNQSLIADSVKFFPQYLQAAGYETAFMGKWHMGEHHADPRKGFDHWFSLKGQGTYYNPVININGEEKQFGDSTYITDLLTEEALDWLGQRDGEKPFFLYLSHKGVHADFKPAPRHKGVYADGAPSYPPTMYPEKNPDYNYKDVPGWVKNQRHSWHGVDYMYHGQINFDEFYQLYNETLLSVDESIGKVIDYIEETGQLDNTVIFYMGDNGFSFGEHGLIDKRQAYEESIRVPLLVYGSKEVLKRNKVKQMIQNIDIGPTILEMAGLEKPDNMDGESFLSILKGEDPQDWRERIYYEYYWERPFPQTPTTYAVRTGQYKFIRYHGIWDINELYDIQNDPWEMNNLIRDPEYKELSKELRQDLFQWLQETNGMQIPLKTDGNGARFDHKYRGTF